MNYLKEPSFSELHDTTQFTSFEALPSDLCSHFSAKNAKQIYLSKNFIIISLTSNPVLIVILDRQNLRIRKLFSISCRDFPVILSTDEKYVQIKAGLILQLPLNADSEPILQVWSDNLLVFPEFSEISRFFIHESSFIFDRLKLQFYTFPWLSISPKFNYPAFFDVERKSIVSIDDKNTIHFIDATVDVISPMKEYPLIHQLHCETVRMSFMDAFLYFFDKIEINGAYFKSFQFAQFANYLQQKICSEEDLVLYHNIPIYSFIVIFRSIRDRKELPEPSLQRKSEFLVAYTHSSIYVKFIQDSIVAMFEEHFIDRIEAVDIKLWLRRWAKHEIEYRQKLYTPAMSSFNYMGDGFWGPETIPGEFTGF